MYQIQVQKWSEVIHKQGLFDAFSSIKDGLKPSNQEFEFFIRHWIVDGTPYLFRDEPMVYEEIRRKMGKDLSTCPTNVGIVGSAKLGFSLTPRKKLREFDAKNSDIDLFVVDRYFFANLCAEYDRGYEAFLEFGENFSEKRKTFLENNHLDITGDGNRTGTMNRGFIDSNKIPTGPKIGAGPYLNMCERSISSIKLALQKRYEGLKLKKPQTLRVYRDMDALMLQYRINLEQFVTKAQA